MTILAIVQGVQDIVGAVAGIRAAPDYAPDAVNIFPVAVTYPTDGVYTAGPGYGVKKGLHTIVVEIHLPRVDLPKSIQASIGYIESVSTALIADPTLGGTASTFESVQYTYGSMAWGEGDSVISTFGVRFTLTNVKEIT